MACDVMIGRT